MALIIDNSTASDVSNNGVNDAVQIVDISLSSCNIVTKTFCSVAILHCKVLTVYLGDTIPHYLLPSATVQHHDTCRTIVGTVPLSY